MMFSMVNENELIVTVFLIWLGVGACILLWGLERAERTVLLNDIANRFRLDRLYYGNNKEKPAQDCYYDKNRNIPGWYENDDSFKVRLLNHIKNPKMTSGPFSSGPNKP